MRAAYTLAGGGFNTQPPEGGWDEAGKAVGTVSCFNTQPPEGGWLEGRFVFDFGFVSTHSRPKAAGWKEDSFLTSASFQHTAARRRLVPP